MAAGTWPSGVMQVAGLVPNVISYNAGVSACEKSDQW